MRYQSIKTWKPILVGTQNELMTLKNEHNVSFINQNLQQASQRLKSKAICRCLPLRICCPPTVVFNSCWMTLRSITQFCGSIPVCFSGSDRMTNDLLYPINRLMKCVSTFTDNTTVLVTKRTAPPPASPRRHHKVTCPPTSTLPHTCKLKYTWNCLTAINHSQLSHRNQMTAKSLKNPSSGFNRASFSTNSNSHIAAVEH